MRTQTLAIAIASLLLAGATLGARPPAAADAATFETLRDSIDGSWPESGSITAAFESDLARIHLEFDFASGAWWRRQFSTGITVGSDPEGIPYSGERSAIEFVAPGERTANWDHALDAFFPTVMLRGLLRDPDCWRSIEQLPEGGWRATFSLPRGSRAFRLEELHEVEIERWGGVDSIARDVVEIDPDLRITSIDVEGRDPISLDTASCSPPGFQIVEHVNAWSPDIELVRCDYSIGSDSSRFSLERVRESVTQARISAPQVTPAFPTDSAESVAPIGRRQTGWQLPLVLTGSTLLMLGAFGWLYVRRGGGR